MYVSHFALVYGPATLTCFEGGTTLTSVIINKFSADVPGCVTVLYTAGTPLFLNG